MPSVPAAPAADTTATARPAAAPIPSPRPWHVLGVVSLGALMGVIDQASVNVSFPLLAASFGSSVSVISWVALAHMITLVAGLTIFGRLADLVGSRRVYVAGLLVFLVGALLAATAQGLGWLIAARVVTGLGASMTVANSVALIGAFFPSTRRGLAIGIVEATVAVGFAVGPVLGGLVGGAFGWRAIFLPTMPLALLAAALTLLLLRDPPRRGPRESFDLPGAATFAGGAAAVLFGLTHGPTLGWSAPTVLGSVGLGATLLALFVRIETRVRHPMIALSLFGHPVFAAANLAKVACYLSLMAAMFLTPFYAQRALGLSAAQAGLAMLPFSVAHAIGSLVMGPLSDRIGSRAIAPAGLALGALGCLLLARVAPEGGYVAMLPGLLVLTLGLSSFITPNDSAIVAAAPRDKLGVASGILAMTRSLGMLLGIALAGTVLAAREPTHAAAGLGEPAAFVAAFGEVFLLTAGACLLGAFGSLVGGRRR